MRILSRNGQESRIVGLGEMLTLRIDVDPTSAFGIMARNVEARTDSGEVMILIDSTGYIVMPTRKKVELRYSRFLQMP